MRILLISANVADSPYPVYPLGMSMVAAALKKEGHRIAFFDFMRDDASPDRLANLLREEEPGLIGISIRNIDNVNSAHEERYIDELADIVGRIKDITSAPVLLGGSGFSLMPEQVLAWSGADYGIVGEGEALACAFARDCESGTLPAERLLRAPQRLESSGITSAYYEPDLLAFYLKSSRMISVQTKRGCTKHCVYCSYPLLEGRDLRMRDAEDVVADIELLMRQDHVDYIFFVDSLFNDSEGRYRELIAEMRRRGIKVPWTAFFSPDSELDDDIIEEMKATGLHAAEIGADASTDLTLHALGKDFLWSDVVECNARFRRHGVITANYYMFGGPGETVASVEEGIENIRNLPDTANFIFMGIRILPDTPLHVLARREGLISEDHNPLETAYYFSPQIERDGLEEALRQGFADHANCVFPPDELDTKLQLLHRLGISGCGYDLLSKKRGGS